MLQTPCMHGVTNGIAAHRSSPHFIPSDHQPRSLIAPVIVAMTLNDVPPAWHCLLVVSRHDLDTAIVRHKRLEHEVWPINLVTRSSHFLVPPGPPHASSFQNLRSDR